jgi:hypothetical protein
MSKHYNSNLTKRDDAVTKLRDAYSAAQAFGMTHADLMVAVCKARDTLKGCPRWAEAHFSGYQRALADALYHTSLVYGGIVGGRLYTTHASRPDYYGKHGITPCEWATGGRVTQAGHYWTPELVRMTIRPFFVSEP